MTESLAPVEVLVCSTCRAGQPTDQEGPRPGTVLADALMGKDWPTHITIKKTKYLSNCDSGCSIAVRDGTNH